MSDFRFLAKARQRKKKRLCSPLGTPREVGASACSFCWAAALFLPASRAVGKDNTCHAPTWCQRISGMGNIMQAP